MKLKILLSTILVMIATASMAQVRLGFGLGYAIPNEDLKEATDYAIGYAINARFAITDKIEVGLEYDGNVLAAVSNPNVDDIGVFTVSGLLGKFQYNFLDRKVTPYVAVGLGYYTSKTPEISAGGITIQEELKNTSFGFAPEVGVNLGGFGIGAKYIMAGDMAGIEGVKADMLKIFIAYNIKFG